MPDDLPAPPRPDTDDLPAWRAYWPALGMSWRTEPEIDAEHQAYLAQRRAVTPDIERGIYPFRDEKGSIKLTRADVEWLLATHESGGMHGPVDWADKKQRVREGLDLRGADLGGADLSGLPLARTRAALAESEARAATRHQIHLAAVRLEQADLRAAQLEFAILGWARLEGADLTRARLTGADLFAAHLEGANLTNAELSGADLQNVYFDAASYLAHTTVSSREHGSFIVADVRWEGVNLARVQWTPVRMLGDERRAHRVKTPDGRVKTGQARLASYRTAVRANRQLATVLRGQGLNEDADRFAYRAQLLQRQVLLRQRNLLRYLSSLLLDLVSGYGYKPLRSLIAYVLVIGLFAGAYLLNAQFAAPHLTWDESLVLSISSFHGRGFFSSGISLGDTLARLAAGEAVLGLLIEITFIATFTQRFFAR